MRSLIAASKEVRFVIVGVGAALALFTMSWAFLAAGMPAFQGTVLAYFLAFLGAYAAQRNWTFRVTHSHSRSLSRYLVTQLACAALSGLVAYGLTHGMGAGHWFAAAAATVSGSGASYMLSSRWAFA